MSIILSLNLVLFTFTFKIEESSYIFLIYIHIFFYKGINVAHKAFFTILCIYFFYVPYGT